MGILHMYVFGESKPQFPDYKYIPFCCLRHESSVVSDHHQSMRAGVDRGQPAEREVYFHEGETAGRDGYPANPSPELADALQRAGWARCFAPVVSEQEQARKLSVPV